ncbi:hypothetical protein JBKA6_1109 [Ichthyobacterium seriolicida]|uniref:Transposase n=1 Tax=Ichthyobacterium seriolicida TaxID=242600 RepID=A0A1J1DYX2_9FLAO|nr:hypothetical protein JBKA6_1109 [Ichthyobacterium seriolicida]
MAQTYTELRNNPESIFNYFLQKSSTTMNKKQKKYVISYLHTLRDSVPKG